MKCFLLSPVIFLRGKFTPLLITSLFLCFAFKVSAQQAVINLPVSSGDRKMKNEEKESTKNPFNFRMSYNVTHPSLTIFLPDSVRKDGMAIMLCPGGGFRILMTEHEGTNIARQLTQKGITVFLLKYTVKHSKTDDPWAEVMADLKSPERNENENMKVLKFATADAKAGLSYIRENVNRYQLNPARIGVMGFSAGGYLATQLVLDSTEKVRPDFAAILYGNYPVYSNITIPNHGPPLFIAAASDDAVINPLESVMFYNAWIKAGNKAELHMFIKGGHGLKIFPGNSWMMRFEDWMKALAL
ncbi:MAG: alpha/beta hydrolase [Ferruginibacter sp.]